MLTNNCDLEIKDEVYKKMYEKKRKETETKIACQDEGTTVGPRRACVFAGACQGTLPCLFWEFDRCQIQMVEVVKWENAPSDQKRLQHPPNTRQCLCTKLWIQQQVKLILCVITVFPSGVYRPEPDFPKWKRETQQSRMRMRMSRRQGFHALYRHC